MASESTASFFMLRREGIGAGQSCAKQTSPKKGRDVMTHCLFGRSAAVSIKRELPGSCGACVVFEPQVSVRGEFATGSICSMVLPGRGMSWNTCTEGEGGSRA